ncbi:DUF1254 domain-containing protein [Nocardioides sp. LS1]|uniref:DUF1254 domain-containing protein n=1 Tax=Nocardioides sp. LS1 TaxID=1027620 RepID=UPI000F61DA93|nr:DUF1254 domain-containing protein [Nocardioides sp. LS1]GCD88260.1 membrane protein [Nocardioides sp. LS1]
MTSADRRPRHVRTRLGAALVVLTASLASTLASAVVAGQPGALAAGATRPDLLPDCVYGASAPGLTGLEPRVQRDAWAYADHLAGTSATQRLAAARTFAAAEAGYVYGLPLVDLHDTVRQFRFRNTLVSVASLSTPETRSVVSPNVDTAYTVGWLSLTQGPLVIDVPDTDGRFYTFQFMDAWTNSFTYVGSGATGTEAGSYLFVPPGWTGDVPEGVHLVHSPTNTMWLLGRTLVDDAADMQRVKPLLEKYTATPLEAWRQGARGKSVVFDNPPPRPPKPATPQGTDFVAALNQETTIDPPPSSQRCVLDALAPAGVQQPDTTPGAVLAADSANAVGDPPGSGEDTPQNRAVRAGTRAAVRLIAGAADRYRATTSAGNRGWSVMTDPWIGDFGRQYLGRAVIATDLLGANVPRIATYPTSYTDGHGRALNGGHRYTITFPQGQLPPVRAFWSLTMYRQDNFLYDNQIDRYSVGDRDRGLRRNADGSLTIFVQHAKPRSAKARANWLPAPAGDFHLILRLYLPEKAALDGAYRIPPFVRVD